MYNRTYIITCHKCLQPLVIICMSLYVHNSCIYNIYRGIDEAPVLRITSQSFKILNICGIYHMENTCHVVRGTTFKCHCLAATEYKNNNV